MVSYDLPVIWKGICMELGARLELLRKKSGWSQSEVARRMNLSSSTVCKHEYGNREPNLDALRRYAELYDVSLEYLLGLIDNQDVTIPMIASLNQMKSDKDRLCDKDIADIKRFLRIFRFVLIDYLFGITDPDGAFSHANPSRALEENARLCDKDICDLKRFLNTFRMQ